MNASVGLSAVTRIVIRLVCGTTNASSSPFSFSTPSFSFDMVENIVLSKSFVKVPAISDVLERFEKTEV